MTLRGESLRLKFLRLVSSDKLRDPRSSGSTRKAGCR